MAYKYLQSFLDARLFTIAEENSNYQFLVATIPLFEKAVAKNKNKIIAATLVALDQNIRQEDPILDEVEGLLKRKWPLVRNKYIDRPSTLLRAIILESLNILMQENRVVANIIWLTGSNFLTFVNAGNEAPILHQWLKEAGEMSEINATKEWELTSSASELKIPNFSLGKISLSNVTFEKKGLMDGLDKAVINGVQIIDSYGVQVRQDWATKFSATAAESIFSVFSNAFNTLTTSLNAMNIDKPINDFFTVFKDDLERTITTSHKSSERLQLRSQILWWKEALYSVNAQKSYRDMKPAQVALNMAIDLASDIPAVYPVSIDYILKETVLSCLGADEADKTIGELLLQLTETTGKIPIVIDLPEDGRISFGAFVAGLDSKKTNPEELMIRTGIPSESKISYRQLAVLLFHDIKAFQINLR